MGAEGLRRMLLAAGVSGALALSLPSVSGAASTFAWGEGAGGALGVEDVGAYGTRVAAPAPQPLVGVTSVAAGSNFGLAVAGGTVYAWGQGGGGALGNGTRANASTPTPVPGLGPAKQVAAAASTGYALMADGTVEAWGRNNRGQLGQGSHSGPETCESLACSTVPAPVPGLSHVRAISAGESHVLALLEDGTVEAWGSNGFGQLGDATTEGRDSPVAVSGLSEVVAVAAGAWFSVALLADGEVRTWGLGDVGQLGDGATSNSSVPLTVSGLAEVTAIAAGESHALALLGNGEVRSWGANSRGQLGDGTATNRDQPVAVSGLTGATAVAAGAEHSLAIVAGGVESWGDEVKGQLGNGYRQSQNYPPTWVEAPVQVICGLHGIEGIAAGGRAQSYAWGADQETCPGVGGLAPDLGLESGGTEVTITGTGFGSASAVTFGSTPATSFAVESAGRIRAIAPAGAESAVDVTVTNAEGTSVATPLDRYVFTGIPTVTGVSQSFSTAGTEVSISGTNLNAVTSVHFGALASPSVTLSGGQVRAVVPPGEGLVDVTVTNPVATSAVTPADEFLYRTVYEFGRCIKVGEQRKSLSYAGCPSDVGRSGPYEWFPAAFGSGPLERSGVELGPGSLTFETKTKLKIRCSGVQGAGHITGYDLIGVEDLTLRSCASPRLGTCTSSGAATGEVRADPVSVRLGRVSSSSVPMVQLEPASGETLARMSCGSHAVTATGSFIGQIGKAGKMLGGWKISATERKGVPAFAGLVNRPPASAGVIVDGGAVQPAGVRLKVIEKNEEAIEIR